MDIETIITALVLTLIVGFVVTGVSTLLLRRYGPPRKRYLWMGIGVMIVVLAIMVVLGTPAVPLGLTAAAVAVVGVAAYVAHPPKR